MLNFFLAWLIKAVLFVPAILTLGLLFLFIPFIVNTVLLWLTDKLIGSFRIETMGGLLVSAAVDHAGQRRVPLRRAQPPDGPSQATARRAGSKPEGV